MGAGIHGGFGNTKGMRNAMKMNIQFFASKAFEQGGKVTDKSLSGHREFFLGKSIKKIQKILSKYGYKTKLRPSIHSNSKAQILVTTNPSKTKNISQIQVSKSGKRHGNVSYVKISTTDIGKYKIINTKPENYKTDGKETAKLLFRR